MNAFPLYMEDGRRAGPWACGTCRTVHGCETTAASCCEPPSCSSCGEATEKGRTRCRTCMSAHFDAIEKARWETARKIPPSEYAGHLVWSDDYDEFFDDLDCLVDRWLDDERTGVPRVYACRPFGLRWEAYRILDHALDEHHEEAVDSIPDGAMTELQAALDAWASRFGPTSYEPDRSVAILVDPQTYFGGNR